MKNAAVEEAKKEQQYEEETTIALENTIKKAAVPTALVDRLLSLTFSQLTYVLGRRRRADTGEH